ncbi:MAG: hypothetical protein K8T20_01150, partial [Planctomycetes bacterium]|nr:hypothetical protein [Planctomycetota bacterium]
AREMAARRTASQVATLLESLHRNQLRISVIFAALDNLSDSLFTERMSRGFFRRQVALSDALPRLVEDPSQTNYVHLTLLASPELRGNAVARRILQDWIPQLGQGVNQQSFQSEIKYEVPEISERTSHSDARPKGLEVLANVQKQKEAIKLAIVRGNRSSALKFARELVQSQRRNSSNEQIAKSLCDLAQQAKLVGDSRLQSLFSEWAVSECPTDAWSRSQFADALRSLGEWDRAIEAYKDAASYGDSRIALCGSAAVLADMGEMQQAETIIRECIRRFPQDIVARNTYAELRRDQGRLKESLDEYEAIRKEFGEELVTSNAYANVLRDMGRFNEAIAVYDGVLLSHPKEFITLHGRAELLRDAGFTSQSMREFREIIKEFPDQPVAKYRHACLQRDTGHVHTALAEFEKLMLEFKSFAPGYNGFADCLKRIGRLEQALKAYKRSASRFPRSLAAIHGQASVLGLQSKFEEALAILPISNALTREQWKGKHLRGVILLKMGKLDEALQVLREGKESAPWHPERSAFACSLAIAELRSNRASSALESLMPSQEFLMSAQVGAIRAHASLASGRRGEFKKNVRTISQVRLPAFKEISAALQKAFDSRDSMAVWELQVCDLECNMVLSAA